MKMRANFSEIPEKTSGKQEKTILNTNTYIIYTLYSYPSVALGAAPISSNRYQPTLMAIGLGSTNEMSKETSRILFLDFDGVPHPYDVYLSTGEPIH